MQTRFLHRLYLVEGEVWDTEEVGREGIGKFTLFGPQGMPLCIFCVSKG